MMRTRRMEKIGTLLRRIEQMRERELQGAVAAVNAIVELQAREVVAQQSESSSGRAALERGDLEEWMLAEAGRELIGLRMPRHRELEAGLEQQRLLAAEALAGSRVQREQVERLATDQRRKIEALEIRNVQAAADDRFLARRVWVRNSRAAASIGRQDRQGAKMKTC